MTTNRHTPGPWVAHHQTIMYGGCPTTVFEVHQTSTVDETVKTLVASCKNMDDAHLIAAAPELLEALQHCVSLLKDYADKHARDALETENNWHLGPYEECILHINASQTAINKALNLKQEVQD